jgi:PAS domain S-box-containing protein
MNPVAEALTCWKQEEVLGSNLSRVFQTINEITREVVESPVALALREGATVGLENHTLLITKDGTEIPIDDSAAPIRNEDGSIIGAVLVFHDVTEQQQIKAILQKTNEELAERVAESITQLKTVNEQLRAEIDRRQQLESEMLLALEKERELNELKSRIVATISHEYRTPLTTILSSTELLEQYGSNWTEDRKRKHFQRIQASVKYLTDLVNDVLFINEAEVGSLKFEPAPLNIEQVTRELVEEFQLEDAGKHIITLECQETSTNALLDKNLLQSMLRNLLSNAIQYSPEGSQVRLELIFEESEVIFRISDQGIGIPSSDQVQLFNAFFRGSNVGTIPGVGLGLVIVKETVDLHRGEIVVNSEVGVGTTFTVTLPLVEAVGV